MPYPAPPPSVRRSRPATPGPARAVLPRRPTPHLRVPLARPRTVRPAAQGVSAMPSAVQQDPGPARMRRSLGVKDGVAIAASSTAATTSIGIGLGTGRIYGTATPAIMLLAFVPILGIAGCRSPGSTGWSRTRQRLYVGGAVARPLARIHGRVGGTWWTRGVPGVHGPVTGSAVDPTVPRQAGLRRVGRAPLDPASTGAATAVGLVAWSSSRSPRSPVSGRRDPAAGWTADLRVLGTAGLLRIRHRRRCRSPSSLTGSTRSRSPRPRRSRRACCCRCSATGASRPRSV